MTDDCFAIAEIRASGVTYYVLQDHTLGYINPAQPLTFCPLACDVHGLPWQRGPVLLMGNERKKLATIDDFKKFRVDHKGHLT
jgi:hypothetical protein